MLFRSYIHTKLYMICISFQHIYKYMREHYLKVVEDRLVLLNAYRTLHMVIPQVSPFSGEFFTDVLNITKYIEDKRESRVKHLIHENTIMEDPADVEGGIISDFLECLLSCSHRLIPFYS